MILSIRSLRPARSRCLRLNRSVPSLSPVTVTATATARPCLALDCRAPHGVANVHRQYATETILKQTGVENSAAEAQRRSEYYIDETRRHTNFERNQMLKKTFTSQEEPIDGPVMTEKLRSAFVSSIRVYPDCERSTRKSKEAAVKAARRQIAYDKLAAERNLRITDDLPAMMELLAEMMPFSEDGKLLLENSSLSLPGEKSENMVAVRVILPEWWDIDVNEKSLEYIRMNDGLSARLRMSPDQRGPSALLLRGRSEVVTRAVDELVAACSDVQVHRLGEMSALDTSTIQLWPPITHRMEDVAYASEDQLAGLWVHRDVYEVDQPYEKMGASLNPWSPETFSTYIEGLVYGRLRPDLARGFYAHLLPGTWRKDLDTDGIKVRLMMKAFHDPNARPHISLQAVKNALHFVMQRGGHRAAAEKLLAWLPRYGVLLDTDVFNIMLHGYATNHDARHFHLILLKMKKYGVPCNTRTWLLFLQLVQKDEVRDQVILFMDRFGMVDDGATRGAVASILASRDAHAAFTTGKSMNEFFDEQMARYGDDWFQEAARLDILREMLRCLIPNKPLKDAQMDDIWLLLDRRSEKGHDADIAAANLLLLHVRKSPQKPLLVRTLAWMSQHGIQADQTTYSILLQRCLWLRALDCFGLVFFHGVFARKLDTGSRVLLKQCLLGAKPGVSPRQLRLFPRRVEHEVQQGGVRSALRVVSALERFILDAYAGYEPVKSLPDALTAVLGEDAAASQDVGGGNSTRRGSGKKTPSYISVLLRHKEGKQPDQEVLLDGVFDPTAIIKKDEAQTRAQREQLERDHQATLEKDGAYELR